MKNIVTLSSQADFEGKAGNLNRLFGSFQIANGFIITDEYFRLFLETNDISLDEEFEYIESAIEEGKMPNEEELLEFFENQNFKEVIVRSSANIEDGARHSFAGQFESFPRVSKDTLIENIKKCWLSSQKENVTSYIKKNKLSDKFRFDVLVQEMIEADTSGIAFTINPSTGEEGILIEASSGACENIVNGSITPYTYDKTSCGDESLSQRQLQMIESTLKKLKGIFKKEIEIEFCFKDNDLYLFQVRPITSIHYSLHSHIENVYWCAFKNNDWTLFNRSLWILGATKYKNARIKNEVTEDVTLYLPNNESQIRGFNGGEPPLDEETIASHSEKDILNYLDEYDNIVKNIYKISQKVNINITENDFSEFRKNLTKLIEQNAILESYEYLIGSLGQVLFDTISTSTRKKIEEWRNDESNSYFPIYDQIFLYIKNHFNIDLDCKFFRMYTHVEELLKLCQNKLKVSTLLKRIDTRIKKGFVLLNLHNKSYQNKVLTNSRIIKAVESRFCSLQNGIMEENDCSGIKGHSTFKLDKKIVGECVVLKGDLKNFNTDIKDKIVICEVTTARDIDYLKSVKALIVDNGGILCHSAIFSREFKIPCLMGCVNATKYFKTGNKIEIDLIKEQAKIIEGS